VPVSANLTRILPALAFLIAVMGERSLCAELLWNAQTAGTHTIQSRHPSHTAEFGGVQSDKLFLFSVQESGTSSQLKVDGSPASSKLKIRIAGAQISVSQNVKANKATISRAIDFALAEKADILLTPEGSLSGYTNDFDPVAVTQALNSLTEKARRAGLALALSTCFEEPEDKQRYNEIRFYDRSGAYLGFHSKILLCKKVNASTSIGELDLYKSKPLETFRLSGLTIGGLLCNDFWANPEWTPMDDPHLAQQLAAKGARIILLAVNGGPGQGEEIILTRQYHEANLRLRARAAKVWVVVVDNCGNRNDLSCSAPGGVIDPTGKWVYKTSPKGEHLFAYTIEVGP
jgi:predicted amidohydrolase